MFGRSVTFVDKKNNLCFFVVYGESSCAYDTDATTPWDLPLSAADTEKISLIPRYCRVVTCLVLSRTAFAYIPPPCVAMCSGWDVGVSKRQKTQDSSTGR